MVQDKHKNQLYIPQQYEWVLIATELCTLKKIDKGKILCYVHFTKIFLKIIASGSYFQIKYPRLAENMSLLEGF